MSRHLILSMIIFGLAGCGGSHSAPADPTISCDFAADDECDQVSGPQAALDVYGFNAASCAASGGVVVSACPTTGRVGRCTVTQTSGTTTVTAVMSFYAPTYDQASVATGCVLGGGTFTPRMVGQGSTWNLNPVESVRLEEP